MRGRTAAVLLCARCSRRPVGSFQDTGVWTEVRVRFSSRLIALSPISGADPSASLPYQVRPGLHPTAHHLPHPLFLPMDDDVPPGIGGRSGPRPTAMTSAVHPRFRPRSQITVLDVDLASALSVAPAPHSWKDAEERVLSEFGGNFSSPSPTSVAADPQSPNKGYFVDDLKCVWKKPFLFSILYDRSIHS